MIAGCLFIFLKRRFLFQGQEKRFNKEGGKKKKGEKNPGEIAKGFIVMDE